MLSKYVVLSLGAVCAVTSVFFLAPVIAELFNSPPVLKYEYSDIGFDYGCSYYTIDNSLSNAAVSPSILSSLRLSDKNMDGYKDGIKNVVGRIYDGQWQYQYNETYKEYVQPQTECKMVAKTTKNGTEYFESNCSVVREGFFAVKWRYSWVSIEDIDMLSKVSVDARQVQSVRWCAKIERVGGDFRIKADHIPQFNGVDYAGFDWWDISYPFRYKINSKSTSTNYTNIISVNDSAGVGGNVSNGGLLLWTNNATGSTPEDIYLYCQNAGCANGAKAIANETAEKFWLNETDGTGNNPNSVTNNQIVAWWTMNNLTGTDVSGERRNLTLTSVKSVNSILGKGWGFDGTASKASIADTDVGNLEGMAALTISGWVWFNDTTLNYIVVKDNGGSVYLVAGFSSGCAGSNKFYAWVKAAALKETCSATVITAGVWYHFAVTYDSAGAATVKQYLNGNLEATSAATSGAVGTNTQALAIGSDYAGNAPYLNATLDDLRFYNISLSQKEIQDLYYQGVNNHTSLGSEETIVTNLPTNISLYLNDTENNRTYSVGSWANFTAIINVSGVNLDMDANMTGWVIQSNETGRIENISYLKTLGNLYNITAYWKGNTTYAPANRTYFFNVTVPSAEIVSCKIDYGVDISFIGREFMDIKVR